MQDEAHTPVSGLFESIIVERRRFCVSKKCDHWKRWLLRSRHTKREPNGSLFVCQTASGMRSHVTVSERPQEQKAQMRFSVSRNAA